MAGMSTYLPHFFPETEITPVFLGIRQRSKGEPHSCPDAKSFPLSRSRDQIRWLLLIQERTRFSQELQEDV